MTGAQFAAVDVHYPATGGARAGCVVAAAIRYQDIVAVHVATLGSVAPYRPGEFYARELSAIRAVCAIPIADRFAGGCAGGGYQRWRASSAKPCRSVNSRVAPSSVRTEPDHVPNT